MGDTNHSVINFGAGPSKLPRPVLLQAQRELLDYQGLGISVMEMSHRSAEFAKIMNRTEGLIRDLLNIPTGYQVLLVHGGGSGQFSAIPLNLLSRPPPSSSSSTSSSSPVAGGGGCADYVVSGAWSSKAAEEARKYGAVRVAHEPLERYTRVPECVRASESASYLYYCSNETIHGVEFATPPAHHAHVPLVCDMSSSFLSRPVPIAEYGLIMAGAQKNAGCAGVTVVIVRESLLGAALPVCPAIMDYSVLAKDGSLYNTPPCYSIYMMMLVLEWIAQNGGADGMAALNEMKSRVVYAQIDNSDGFYSCPVETSCRSRMNIPFRLSDETLERKFLSQASERGFLGLKGHRSVGGVRASLYNAVSVSDTEILAAFMEEFRLKQQQP